MATDDAARAGADIDRYVDVDCPRISVLAQLLDLLPARAA